MRILIVMLALAFTGCSTVNGIPSMPYGNMGGGCGPLSCAQTPAYWYGYTQGRSYGPPVSTSPMGGK
jgi:hypothetical protein